MLKALGFSEFAEVYLLGDYGDNRKRTRSFVNNNVDHPDFDEKPLVREFIQNIHSREIMSMYIKRLNEYYNESFIC